jgi:MerR family copper efflux transcriptional regulator
MQIGLVAKKVGLSVDAIRFYERNALLPRPARTQGGFRRYGEGDVETLAFIRAHTVASDFPANSKVLEFH